MNVTILYQDPETRAWATEMEARVRQLAGIESIRTATWHISALVRPEVLTEAVRSAAQADVVLVAVSGAEALPLELHVWFDAWLARRAHTAGSLVALVGEPARPSHQTARALDYFRTIAHRGGLDFFPQTRPLRPESHALPTPPPLPQGAPPRSSGAARVHPAPSRHWGLNE